MADHVTITWPPCRAFPDGGTETYQVIDVTCYRVCSSGALVAMPRCKDFDRRMDPSCLVVAMNAAEARMHEAIDAAVHACITQVLGTLYEDWKQRRALERFRQFMSHASHDMI